MNVTSEMCQHSEILLTVAFGLVGLLGWLYWREIRDRQNYENSWKKRLEQKLDTALAKHEACQRQLPEKYAKIDEIAKILGKQDETNKLINQFHMIFRTKAEAEKDWRSLEIRLSGIEKTLGRVEAKLVGEK